MFRRKSCEAPFVDFAIVVIYDPLKREMFLFLSKDCRNLWHLIWESQINPICLFCFLCIERLARLTTTPFPKWNPIMKRKKCNHSHKKNEGLFEFGVESSKPPHRGEWMVWQEISNIVWVFVVPVSPKSGTCSRRSSVFLDAKSTFFLAYNPSNFPPPLKSCNLQRCNFNASCPRSESCSCWSTPPPYACFVSRLPFLFLKKILKTNLIIKNNLKTELNMFARSLDCWKFRRSNQQVLGQV